MFFILIIIYYYYFSDGDNDMETDEEAEGAEGGEGFEAPVDDKATVVFTGHKGSFFWGGALNIHCILLHCLDLIGVRENSFTGIVPECPFGLYLQVSNLPKGGRGISDVSPLSGI